MRIIKWGITYSRSIRMADYKYYKPAVYAEGLVEDGEDPKEALEKLKAECRAEMQVLIEEEKALYAQNLQIAQLQRIMKEHPADSTEYILAREKYEKFKAGELE